MFRKHRAKSATTGLFESATIREEFYRTCEGLFSRTGAGPMSMVIAGAGGGEGATTVALNLAHAFAVGESRRTLLVDANFRRPALHNVLEVPLKPGLTDWDMEHDPPYQVTALSPRLSVMTAGSQHLHSVWERSTAMLPDFFARAVAAFDVVLWDAAPICKYPDTLALLRVTGNAVLVTESDQTTLSSVAYAREQVSSVGGQIVGVILNRRGRYVPRLFAR